MPETSRRRLPEPSPRPSFSPLYQQIKSAADAQPAGRRVEAGRGHSQRDRTGGALQVSQGTVRKAIDELAAENLLVRRQGKGTFVATHAEAQIQYRFLRLTPDDGAPRRAAAPAARLPAHARAGRGGAAAGAEGRRGRGAGAPPAAGRRTRPVVLDDIWLPGTLFKGLTAERLAACRGPMYRLFEAEFGVRMIRAEEKIRAVAAGAEEAALLGVPPGAPLLSVERLSFTYGDRPVELRRGLYHTAAAPLPQRAELSAVVPQFRVSLLRCNKLIWVLRPDDGRTTSTVRTRRMTSSQTRHACNMPDRAIVSTGCRRPASSRSCTASAAR